MIFHQKCPDPVQWRHFLFQRNCRPVWQSPSLKASYVRHKKKFFLSNKWIKGEGGDWENIFDRPISIKLEKVSNFKISLNEFHLEMIKCVLEDMPK
jgi:hypothetical protein